MNESMREKLRETKCEQSTGRRRICVDAGREVLHERVVKDGAIVEALEVVQAAAGFVAR